MTSSSPAAALRPLLGQGDTSSLYGAADGDLPGAADPCNDPEHGEHAKEPGTPEKTFVSGYVAGDWFNVGLRPTWCIM